MTINIGIEIKTIRFPNNEGHPITNKPIIIERIKLKKGTKADATARTPSTTRSPSPETTFNISPDYLMDNF